MGKAIGGSFLVLILTIIGFIIWWPLGIVFFIISIVLYASTQNRKPQVSVTFHPKSKSDEENIPKDVSKIKERVDSREYDITSIKSAPVKKTPREYFSSGTKEYVLKKQNGKCAICQTGKIPLEFDHKDGDPSNSDYRNCQALCPNCHREKTRRESSNRRYKHWQ